MNSRPLGFFAMKFPTMFINGSYDVTISCLVDVKFNDFVEHIYYNQDNRVAKHSQQHFPIGLSH